MPFSSGTLETANLSMGELSIRTKITRGLELLETAARNVPSALGS